MNRQKLEAFMAEIGRLAEGPGNVYLVGGATALLLGMREQTVDIDVKLDPEPKAVFEGIADLKERLSVNVELAAPDQFIPAVPGWRERSIPIGRFGSVEFLHYDLYGQTLAKIQRGHAQDLADARGFVEAGRVDVSELQKSFEAIQPELARYPAIDPEEFRRQFRDFVNSLEDRLG